MSIGNEPVKCERREILIGARERTNARDRRKKRTDEQTDVRPAVFIIIRWRSCCLEFRILFMVSVAFQFICPLCLQGRLQGHWNVVLQLLDFTFISNWLDGFFGYFNYRVNLYFFMSEKKCFKLCLNILEIGKVLD